jgi:hypothetical protein
MKCREGVLSNQRRWNQEETRDASRRKEITEMNQGETHQGERWVNHHGRTLALFVALLSLWAAGCGPEAGGSIGERGASFVDWPLDDWLPDGDWPPDSISWVDVLAVPGVSQEEMKKCQNSKSAGFCSTNGRGYCRNGQFILCATNQVCRHVTWDLGRNATCVDNPDTHDDPCEGITYYGTCVNKGNVSILYWCKNGLWGKELIQKSCPNGCGNVSSSLCEGAPHTDSFFSQPKCKGCM